MKEFIHILKEPGIDIEQFQSSENDIFPNARTYPPFLDQNLLSPLRVVKYFADDPHSNIRVFYYHLLKMSYELVLEEGNVLDYPINNFKDKIFGSDFQIMFSRYSEEQRVLFNDFQFKRLLAQFFILLEREEDPDIEVMVNRYPIIDIVFIHIFRSLLCNLGIDVPFDDKIQTEIVFGQLCHLFQIGLGKYDDCWKFEQSDMFCLDQTGTDLYFIYTFETDNHNKSRQNTSQSVEKQLQKVTQQKQPSKIKNQYISNKQNTFTGGDIVSDFAQLCSSKKDPFLKNDLNNDLLKLELSAGKLLSNSGMFLQISTLQQNPTKRIRSLADASQKTSFRYDNYDDRKQSFDYVMPDINIYQVLNEIEPSKQSGLQKSKSQTPSYSYTPSFTEEKTQSKKFNFESFTPFIPSYTPYVPSYTYTSSVYQPQIFRPSTGINTNYQPSNYNYQSTYPSTYPSSYTPSQFANKQYQKYDIKISTPIVIQPLNLSTNKSLNLGDYYKDFTNTFLLPMIKQPYQSNLRGLKNRVRQTRRQNVWQSPF